MKSRVELIQESKNVLKIIICLRLGLLKTIPIFAILLLPIGLFISIILIMAAFKGIIFQMSTKDILLLLIFAILPDYIGGKNLYEWLRCNFGREILILNNADKWMSYRLMVLGTVKTKRFYYSDISKIAAESVRRVKYIDYCYCYIEHKQKKFLFGIVNEIEEATDIINKINKFIKK